MPEESGFAELIKPAFHYYACRPMDPSKLSTKTYMIALPASSRKPHGMLAGEIVKTYAQEGGCKPLYAVGTIVLFRHSEAQISTFEPDPRSDELFVFIHEDTILATMEIPAKGSVQ